MDKAELEKLCTYHLKGTCLYFVTQTWWDPVHKDKKPETPPCSLCYAFRSDNPELVKEYQVADRVYVSVYDVMAKHPEVRAWLPGGTTLPGGPGDGMVPIPPPTDALATQEASSTTETEEKPRKYAWEIKEPSPGGTGGETSAVSEPTPSSAKETSSPATETRTRPKLSHQHKLEDD